MKDWAAYTGIKTKHASLLQKTVLAEQYATDLGTRGVLTGSLYAILKHQHREFSKHREKVNRRYQEKRELYLNTYNEVLARAFGMGSYNLSDKVHADIGMFGWRRTPVHSTIYARAGALIGLFSLPGSTCTPEMRYVVDHANKQSESFYYMRQNHTWDSRRAIKIGIVKDVILELLYTKDIPINHKIYAIERLRDMAEKYNGGQRCKEIDKFINLVAKNGWIIPEDLLPEI